VTNKEKINCAKTTVIYNGVDEERFSSFDASFPLKKELGIKHKNLIVGTVSSLTPHKGHIFMLQAAPKILKAFPATMFLIVGDGSYGDELKNQVNKLNISSSVIFTGVRKDIPECLNLMDIFVHPSSSREGLGISIIEAMAAERPVVATHIGGILEVVEDGQTGLLVLPKNPDALAGAVMELLRDPERAQEMGRQGRIKVKETFTTRKMIAEIENLYQNSYNKIRESR